MVNFFQMSSDVMIGLWVGMLMLSLGRKTAVRKHKCVAPGRACSCWKETVLAQDRMGEKEAFMK